MRGKRPLADFVNNVSCLHTQGSKAMHMVGADYGVNVHRFLATHMYILHIYSGLYTNNNNN